MVKEIKLANGKGIVLVDDEDFNILNQYYWSLDSSNYAQKSNKINNKWIPQRMHKLLINTPNGMHTDHIDNNKLNNQKSNLRVVTQLQNLMNRSKNKKCSSKFKGVYWVKLRNNWSANIQLKNKRYFLGYFDNEIEAAKAYNKKAKELFGKYAYLNEV